MNSSRNFEATNQDAKKKKQKFGMYAGNDEHYSSKGRTRKRRNARNNKRQG